MVCLFKMLVISGWVMSMKGSSSDRLINGRCSSSAKTDSAHGHFAENRTNLRASPAPSSAKRARSSESCACKLSLIE